MFARAHRSSKALAAVFAAFTLLACGGGGGGGGGAPAAPAADNGAGLGAGGGAGGGGGAITGGGDATGGGAGVGDGSGTGTGTGTGDGTGTGGTGDGTGTGDGSGAGGETDLTAGLVQIVVSPENPLLVLPDGGAAQSLQFFATGYYSDDSERDLSADVTWTVDPEGPLTVDATGLATAVAPGTATLSATLGSISGSTTVTIAEPPPLPTLSYLSLSKGSVPGGTGVTGTIALTGPVPDGGSYVVHLGVSDNDPDRECAAVTPTEISIAPTSSSATFAVSTTAGTRRCKVTITATLDNGDAVAQKTATLNVRVPR